MYITAFNIYKEEGRDYFYKSFEEILFVADDKIYIKSLTKQEAEKWLNIVNNFLEKKDIEFESWIYEEDDYDDEITDPYYENGVKPSDFY